MKGLDTTGGLGYKEEECFRKEEEEVVVKVEQG